MFSGGSVNTLKVNAVLVTRQDYCRAIGPERLNGLTTAVGNSEAAILRRVNPAGR